MSATDKNELLKEIKHSYSSAAGVLDYLREVDCFQGLGGKPKANPYWYGTIMDFPAVEAGLKEIQGAKVFEDEELKEILENYRTDEGSPIVRLVGIMGMKHLFEN